MHCTTNLITTPVSKIMGAGNLNNTFALTGLCLCFVLLISAEIDSSCPGPWRHYAEIGCTPVFKNPNSKCPERYNCDHLKDIPVDKCYISGYTYEIGESLREEDAHPCDIGCVCSQSNRGSKFICDAVNCSPQPLFECYLKMNATSCCEGTIACPKRHEDRPTCLVDGETYLDGEYFEPEAEPEKRCYCGEGYTGENVEPFCVTPKPSCRAWLLHINDIRENCVPTYDDPPNPKNNCSFGYRCPNARDVVIPAAPNPSDESKTGSEPADPNMQCKFGALTMNVGDELNEATYYDSVCVKCVCEVPPMPTCHQRFSNDECDIPQFDDF